MKGRAWLVLAGILATLLLVAAGCGGDDDEAADDGTTTTAATTEEATAEPDKVTLQLKWVTQAQFAGYYAALEQGY
nr:ABC transporter substrate-binding protein [Actinomycetota bacterium]